MYLEIIEVLPLRTSGLSFLKNMSFVHEDYTFASQFPNRCKSTLNKLIKFIPDLAIPGDFHTREKLFDLDPIIKSRPDNLLLITGIPDNVPSLDFYKYKDAIYTHYLDLYVEKTLMNIGVLFQVVPSNSPLIPISYGAY